VSVTPVGIGALNRAVIFFTELLLTRTSYVVATFDTPVGADPATAVVMLSRAGSPDTRSRGCGPCAAILLANANRTTSIRAVRMRLTVLQLLVA